MAPDQLNSYETLLIISCIDPDSQRCSVISGVVISLDNLAANSTNQISDADPEAQIILPVWKILLPPFFFIALSLFPFSYTNILILRYNNRLKQQLPQKK